LGRLHRGQLLDLAVPGGQPGVTLAPAIVREAEIEIAEGATERNLPDRARAGQVFALGGGEALMRLLHLAAGPALPAPVLRPRRLVAAQDQRVEDAIAQRLLA